MIKDTDAILEATASGEAEQYLQTMTAIIFSLSSERRRRVATLGLVTRIAGGSAGQQDGWDAAAGSLDKVGTSSTAQSHLG